MASTLTDVEIGLIKKMLELGWKNSAIQFYFNTPERPVNNGRISEIKGGDRGQEVPVATKYELEEFLDHHPLTLARLGADEPETPQQISEATQFLVNEEDQVDIRLAPLSDDINEDPELGAFYQELRATALEFFSMGHNTLGELAPKAEDFASALPEDCRDTTINVIWMRGNKLRMLLGAHDRVSDIPDMHPAKLDVACSEALRTVVQAFNVFAANSAKARLLDQLSLGPDDRKVITESLPEIEEVVKEAGAISTGEAQNALIEEVEDAQSADASPAGDRQVSFAGRSVTNFFTTIIVKAYRLVRTGLKATVSAVWTTVKDKTAEAVTLTAIGIASPHATALFEFLKSHYGVVAEFLKTAQANPAVQQFLDFIVKVLGLA
ncbi:hypothetical protein [Shimia abyssi]|uniref:Uncharacterized protein n=1 Tax=Shimia abyssi TaxID=1662395 RepID=A0A2P8FIW1_9RHOB|nr:hypothetical protein [Shimia abyssi]PSL21643.1 hypothetical protein CLV88_10166 [Shimia abyssi]